MATQVSADGQWRWNGWQWVPNLAIPAPFNWPAVRAPAGRRVLVGVAVAAWLFDMVLRAGTIGVGLTALIWVVALTMVLGVRVRSKGARVSAGLAALVATGLMFRASPWLQAADVLAVVGLLGLAAAQSLGLSAFDFGVTPVLRSALRLALHLLAAPGYVVPPVRAGVRLAVGERGRLLVGGLRGVLIGLPVVAVIAVLLASADPIFASLIRVDIDAGDVALHLCLLSAGAWLVAGLVRGTAGEPMDLEREPAWRLGTPEVIAAMVLLDAVFVVFAIAQLVGAVGAGGDVLRAAGVTYSDYARSGFFQLLWVAGITFVSVMTLRGVAGLDGGRAARAFRVLSVVAAALTLLVVAVAWQRLGLYEAAYGWTMERFYSHVFALWIGAAFILAGAYFAGVRTTKRWVYGASGVVGIVVLVGLNLLNPEALVVRLNVDHAASGRFDAPYLGTLSDDAVPAALDALGALPPADAVPLKGQFCGRSTVVRGPAGYNVATQQAGEDRLARCR